MNNLYLPCINWYADSMESEKMLTLLGQVSVACEIEPKRMSEYTTMLAHTKNVFNREGFTAADIESKVNKRRSPLCRSREKKIKGFENTNFCLLCPYSKLYSLYRQEHELNILYAIINKQLSVDTQLEGVDQYFSSSELMCLPGEIGMWPILKYNSLVYSFFQYAKTENINYDKDTLSKYLIDYISPELPPASDFNRHDSDFLRALSAITLVFISNCHEVKEEQLKESLEIMKLDYKSYLELNYPELYPKTVPKKRKRREKKTVPTGQDLLFDTVDAAPEDIERVKTHLDKLEDCIKEPTASSQNSDAIKKVTENDFPDIDIDYPSYDEVLPDIDLTISTFDTNDFSSPNDDSSITEPEITFDEHIFLETAPIEASEPNITSTDDVPANSNIEQEDTGTDISEKEHTKSKNASDNKTNNDSSKTNNSFSDEPFPIDRLVYLTYELLPEIEVSFRKSTVCPMEYAIINGMDSIILYSSRTGKTYYGDIDLISGLLDGANRAGLKILTSDLPLLVAAFKIHDVPCREFVKSVPLAYEITQNAGDKLVSFNCIVHNVLSPKINISNSMIDAMPYYERIYLAMERILTEEQRAMYKTYNHFLYSISTNCYCTYDGTTTRISMCYTHENAFEYVFHSTAALTKEGKLFTVKINTAALSLSQNDKMYMMHFICSLLYTSSVLDSFNASIVDIRQEQLSLIYFSNRSSDFSDSVWNIISNAFLKKYSITPDMDISET